MSEAMPTMNARVVARDDRGFDVHPATAGATAGAARIVARGENGEEQVVYQAPEPALRPVYTETPAYTQPRLDAYPYGTVTIEPPEPFETI
jgi:hypothetical protein